MGNRKKSLLFLLSSIALIFAVFSSDGCYSAKGVGGVNEKEAQELVRVFIESCRKRDFEQAAELWSKDSANDFYPSFEDFCTQTGKIEWEIGKLSEGKKPSIKFIRTTGRLGQIKKFRFFYFKVIEGELFLYNAPVSSRVRVPGR